MLRDRDPEPSLSGQGGTTRLSWSSGPVPQPACWPPTGPQCRGHSVPGAAALGSSLQLPRLQRMVLDEGSVAAGVHLNVRPLGRALL